MARRSRIDAEKTRAGLVDAAAELFETRGYKATSIADICAELEITKGALFHHFESKEHLFREVWARLQVEMDTAARDAAIAARDPNDPYAAFLAGCRTYLDFASRRGFQQVVLIDGPSVLSVTSWYKRDHELGIQNVLAGVEYLARQGCLAPNNTVSTAVLLQSALNGAGFALARQADGVTVESVYEAFESLVRSLR